MTSRSDLCKSVSRPDLHLETPLQEKSNCSHALFGHHPALFIPFSALNIHILPGVNFKIPPPLSPVECQTFFHRVVRPPSSSFFFFRHFSPLSVCLSSPIWLKYRETRPRYVRGPRNIVLSRTKIFDVTFPRSRWFVNFFFFLISRFK